MRRGELVQGFANFPLVKLMEQRIATSKKLGRRPTTQDRVKFGRDLISAMAAAVSE